MVAVVGVDAELVDDLKGVLAPVVDVDQRVVQRSVIIACENVAIADRVGSGKNIRRDYFVD